jgi:hypothetical protein
MFGLLAQWPVLLMFIVITTILFYLNKSKITEGFEDTSSFKIEKMQLCPALKLNIDNNTSLLQTYTEKYSVTSAKMTEHFLKTLEEAFTVNECEEYLKSVAPIEESDTETPRPE